jgi:hypothetical protein
MTRFEDLVMTRSAIYVYNEHIVDDAPWSSHDASWKSYGRARASARSDHYVFALFFRIPFFIFFIFIFFFVTLL